MNEIYLVLGEFTGSLLLIFFANGAMASLFLKDNQKVNIVYPAICWGLAIFISSSVAVLIGGSGNLNPIVTVALMINKKMIIWIGFVVIIFQFIGAIIGQILVDIIYFKKIKLQIAIGEFGIRNVLSIHTPTISDNKFIVKFLSEFFATAILIFTILLLSNNILQINQFIFSQFIIMFLIILGVVVFGPITGFSVNPIRDLCPRIVHSMLPIKEKGISYWKNTWIGTFVPILSGSLVSLVFLI